MGADVRSALDVFNYFLAGAVIRACRHGRHANVFVSCALLAFGSRFSNPLFGEIALALKPRRRAPDA